MLWAQAKGFYAHIYIYRSSYVDAFCCTNLVITAAHSLWQ